MASKKLDKKKLDKYKELLQKAKGDMLHDIKNLSKDGSDTESKDVSGHVLHMADVATDMYDREFSMSLASTEREHLNQIEDALKRIDEKTYGICSECDKSITEVRLKALPHVVTCLKCQEKIESEA